MRWIISKLKTPCMIWRKNCSKDSSYNRGCASTLPPPFSPQKQNQKSNKKKRKQSPSKNPIQRYSSILPNLEALLLHHTHFNTLLRIKELLSSHPHRSLPLSSVNSLSRHLRPRKNLTRFLQLHPLLFTTRSNSDGKLCFGFSLLMEALLEEEHSIAASLEPLRVTTLRKLLMMSSHKRIPLTKIEKSRFLFGFSRGFLERVGDYSHFFRLEVEEDGTRVLELTRWDKSLAVTKLAKEFIEDEDEAMKTFKFPFKRRRELGLGFVYEKRLNLLNTFPLVSPYSEGWRLEQGTLEAEKYRVGLIHEFLSLTLEKRASIHEIVEFREEFTLVGDLQGMLDKQAQTFYLGGTELNWYVFLRKAYDEHGVLLCKDPQVVFNDKLKLHSEIGKNGCTTFLK